MRALFVDSYIGYIWLISIGIILLSIYCAFRTKRYTLFSLAAFYAVFEAVYQTVSGTDAIIALMCVSMALLIAFALVALLFTRRSLIRCLAAAALGIRFVRLAFYFIVKQDGGTLFAYYFNLILILGQLALVIAVSVCCMRHALKKAELAERKRERAYREAIESGELADREQTAEEYRETKREKITFDATADE
ncbi:MAG: hypothetical protein Q4C04_03360 [Clostridia bacterium]|nr:hypothetical protein [Clostridia bacterium]